MNQGNHHGDYQACLPLRASQHLDALKSLTNPLEKRLEITTD